MATLLTSSPVFTLKDNGTFIMQIDDHYFSVDGEVKTVLQILEKSTNFTEACEQYNKFTSESNSVEDFKLYCEQLLLKFNLEVKKKSFLVFEKILLSKNVAGKIANVFTPLFQPLFFWSSISAFLLLSVYLYFFNDNSSAENTSSISVLYTVGLYFTTIIFHEFGHLAACKRFTGKNGGLGFGIYIIYPVFYSNISEIWHATKEQKIIANLAGVYMQMWFSAIYFVVYLILDTTFFLEFSKFLVFICAVQLLPFIRSDGYWLLNDIFVVHNLMDKSTEKVNQFFKNPQMLFKSKTIGDFGLFFYGIFNIIFVLIFAYFQLIYNFKALYTFPQYFMDLIVSLFTKNWSEIKVDSNYFSVVLFYFIIFIYVKKLIIKIFPKRKINS